jgi:hypothetical protein
VNDDLHFVDVPGSVVGHLEGVGHPGPDVSQGPHGALAHDLPAVPDAVRLNGGSDGNLGTLDKLNLKAANLVIHFSDLNFL